MINLTSALEQSRDMIQAALTEARQELAALVVRKDELESLIAQGETFLRGTQGPGNQDGSLKLHEALQRILRESGNLPTSARQLTDDINERSLYRTREGGPVEMSQVHARTSNYDKVFDKAGPLIWLKDEPGSVVPFKDDDSGFLTWIVDNPDGYVINTGRNPKPSYIVLHRSGCGHFKGDPDRSKTKDNIKFCSLDSGILAGWAASAVGGDVTRCPDCLR